MGLNYKKILRSACALMLIGLLAGMVLQRSVRADDDDDDSDDEAEVAGSSVATPSEPEEEASKKNYDLTLNWKNDVIGPVSGGIQDKATVLGSLQPGITLNLERLVGAHALKLTLQGMATYGGNPAASIGDLQGATYIEAPHSAKVFQAYLEQGIASGHGSITAGIQDLNYDFYSTDASAILMNTTFAIGPEFSFSGRNGPSVYPNTGLGSRLSYTPVEWLTTKVGIYQATPGDPNDPHSTHIALNAQDGFLAIAQVDWNESINAQPGVISLGTWRYSHLQDDLSQRIESPDEDLLGAPVKVPSFGSYVLLSQKLYSEVEGKEPGLSGFLRFGLASPEANRFSGSLSLGLTDLGIVRGREADSIGLAVAFARSSSHAIQAEDDQLGVPITRRTETAIEATYRARALSWLYIQPDLQWIIDPGLDPTVPDAWVGAARVEVDL